MAKKLKILDASNYPCKNKSLANIKGEKWCAVPGYEDIYEISSYGRVKSLPRDIHYANGKVINKKEKILSAGIQRAPNKYLRDTTTQLTIALWTNGIVKAYSIRRLVYCCFHESIDLDNHQLTILCKDGNGLNTYYKNLYKANLSDKQQRPYLQKRTVSCFKYLDMRKLAAKGVKKRQKKVTQYDLEGRKVRVFKSIKQAGLLTGTRPTLINQVLSGAQRQTNGYIWRYGDGRQKIDVKKFWNTKGRNAAIRSQKPVAQYSLSGKRIATFSSITEASRKTGVSFSLISRTAAGLLPSTKGHKWKVLIKSPKLL